MLESLDFQLGAKGSPFRPFYFQCSNSSRPNGLAASVESASSTTFPESNSKPHSASLFCGRLRACRFALSISYRFTRLRFIGRVEIWRAFIPAHFVPPHSFTAIHSSLRISATMKFSKVLFSLLLNHISQRAWALDPTDSIMHGGQFSSDERKPT